MIDPIEKTMARFRETRRIEFSMDWAGRNTGAAVAIIILAIVMIVWGVSSGNF